MTAVVVRGDAAHLPLPDSSVDLIVCSPPYFGLRSYADTVKCMACIDMEYNGRDPRQAWADYDAHRNADCNGRGGPWRTTPPRSTRYRRRCRCPSLRLPPCGSACVSSAAA